MRPARFSMRVRLAVFISALSLLTSAALLAVLPLRLERNAELNMERSAESIVRLMGAALAPALDFGDERYAHRQLGQLESLPGVSYAVLLEAEGGQLAGWPEGFVPSVTAQGNRPVREAELLHLALPLRTRGGQEGLLQMGFSLEPLHAQVREQQLEAALLSLILLAVGLFGALVVARSFTAPVRRLTQVAQRIADGDDAAHRALDVTRSDELGQLGEVIQKMLQRLFEEKDRVRALNHELEARVARRTAELNQRLVELKAAQEQLVVADRRVSMGQLAAGVAHEINNPLAFVTSNLQFVRSELKGLAPGQALDTAECLEALSEAVEGCERVRHIVQGLKTFSRTDEERLEPVQLSDALDAALQMATNELKHRARVVVEVEDPRPVKGNSVRLGQVFLNLLINAGHAIGEGGADENLIRVRIFSAPDGRVAASVEDTGCGMAPEVRARLFTPFFTTKPVGSGTGLGLSICQGIITRLGGEIRVDSAPGRGTTFTLLLPPAADEDTPLPGPSPLLGPAPRPARILLVDDDPLVARALERTLGRNHHVDVVLSGAQALGKLGEGPRYDLILCDVMMPQMNGMQLFQTLEALDPSLAERVLFISGGVFTDQVRGFMDAHRERLLDKPIDPALLQARILAAVAQEGLST